MKACLDFVERPTDKRSARISPGAAAAVLICVGIAMTLTSGTIFVLNFLDRAPPTRAFQPAPTSDELNQGNWPCDPRTQLRSSDLCAQWKAADAARDAANWTMWGVFISGAGFFVVFSQLALSQRQIRIGEENSQKEFRAYIRTELQSATVYANGHIGIEISVNNYGRTPADGLILDVIGSIHDPAFSEYRNYRAVGVSAVLHFGPDGKVIAYSDAPLNKMELAAILTGKISISVLGTLKYCDVFGFNHFEEVDGNIYSERIFTDQNISELFKQ